MPSAQIAARPGSMEVRNGELKVWDAVTGREVLELLWDPRRPEGRSAALAFSRDGGRLVLDESATSGGADSLHVWDATPRAEAK